MKFVYKLFTDGKNWIWLWEESKSLDGLTEEQAYADYTMDTSRINFSNVVDNALFGEIQLLIRTLR